MGRKLWMALVAVVLAIGVSGVANASSITINDPGYFQSYQSLLTSVAYKDTVTWSFVTPTGFDIPPDSITSAAITINAKYVNNNLNVVDVNGLFQYNLASNAWTLGWFLGSGAAVNIPASVFTEPWVGGVNQLPVSVTSNNAVIIFGRALDIPSLYLNYAKLDVHYTDGVGGAAVPTPEPGTLVLLGTGLVGLAAYGRKKFRK